MINKKLLAELISCVGEKWVLTKPGDLYVYSFDSALDRGLPLAVVLPGNRDELTRVVGLMARYKQPFVARGAATSLCGGPVPVSPSVVVGVARLNKIGKLDKLRREIQVGPGVVNLKLQQAIAPDKLFFAPDPGSQKACTIGGNVSTNAGGPHCLKYGVTSNNVLALDVVLPDGTSSTFKAQDEGYDLLSFFIGSEGTLGVVTNITLRLIPIPAYIRTMVVSFHSIEEAIQTVTDIIAAGILPATLEAMDKTVVAAVEAFMHAGYPLEAEAVLLIEVDGNNPAELGNQVVKIKDICEKNNSFNYMFAQNEEERQKLWEGRRGSYAAMARLAPNVLVEDGAVPRTKLPEALKRIKEIAAEEGLQVALLFHAGDGNLHPQIIFDERDANQTKIVKAAGYKMLKACVELGGTISGEHGIGIDKREAMKWLFTRETLSLFRRLKVVFDPNNICNPDKLIPLVGKNESSAEEKGAKPVAEGDLLGRAVPQNEDQMVALVKQWAKEKKQFGIQGSKTKYNVSDNSILVTTNLNQILDFDQGNLTITVQGGALISEVRKITEAAGQFLWVAGEGTVGGVVATRASTFPPLRDQILGMRVLLPNGEMVKFGAKTMKNVAGYDAAKLLIGSWGTLGLIVDVTFRLFPYRVMESKAESVKPFLLKDIHRKIKTAFDPFNILGNRTALLKPEDIKRGPVKRDDSPVNIEKAGDQFWAGG